MMNSKVILTLLNLSSGVQADIFAQSGACDPSTCPSQACSDAGVCCETPTEHCGVYLPNQYYHRQVSTSGEFSCWQMGDSCLIQADMKQEFEPGQIHTHQLPRSAELWMKGCVLTNPKSGTWHGFPYTMSLSSPLSQCVQVDGQMCPAKYVPILPEDCETRCPKLEVPATCTEICKRHCVDGLGLWHNDCVKCSDYNAILDNGVCIACRSDQYVANNKCTTCPAGQKPDPAGTKCICDDGSDPVGGQCATPSMHCPDGEHFEHGKCVKDPSPTPAPSPSDHNDDGFPLWLLILIIVLAVIAAGIVAYLIVIAVIYRCCCASAAADGDVEEADGVYVPRESFVAASCAGSEIQIMAGIAVSDNRRSMSALNLNWTPSDASTDARRNTPEPVDRNDVIRSVQLTEV